MTSNIILECIRTLILLLIVIYLWRAGRDRFTPRRLGWQMILGGFVLLFFGSLVDITDEFDALGKFIIIGPTPIQAILEKFVGGLGGFLLIAFGLIRWIPFVSVLSDEVEKQTREILKAKVEAEVSSQAKSKFLANMSHELRTPLNSIIGFSEMISQATEYNLKTPTLIEYGRNINTSSEHLLSLINDILDISKIEAGEMEVFDSEFDLSRLIKSAINMVAVNADEKKISISFTPEKKEYELMADEKKFRQIMLNILSNAIKFTPEGGAISIKLKKPVSDGLIVKIKDTGIGMDPDQMKQAMEIFRQVDNPHNRKVEGTGLGLPLTKSLIELHGGTLTLNSAVNKGTEVSIQIPKDRIIS